jgi:hypothetical protein
MNKIYLGKDKIILSTKNFSSIAMLILHYHDYLIKYFHKFMLIDKFYKIFLQIL